MKILSEITPTFKANKPWCSTKVDESGKHVNGERMFGICGKGCPFPENERKFSIQSSCILRTQKFDKILLLFLNLLSNIRGHSTTTWTEFVIF